MPTLTYLMPTSDDHGKHQQFETRRSVFTDTSILRFGKFTNEIESRQYRELKWFHED